MDLKVKKGIKYFSQSPSLQRPEQGGEGRLGYRVRERFFLFVFNFRRYSNFPDVAFNLGDEQGTQQCFAWLSMCVCGVVLQ